MSNTSSFTFRQPEDGVDTSVAVVLVRAVIEYETASPPSAQVRPDAMLVVLTFVVPLPTLALPSAPVPVALAVVHVVPVQPAAQVQV
jgi:hypothetical protein